MLMFLMMTISIDEAACFYDDAVVAPIPMLAFLTQLFFVYYTATCCLVARFRLINSILQLLGSAASWRDGLGNEARGLLRCMRALGTGCISSPIGLPAPGEAGWRDGGAGEPTALFTVVYTVARRETVHWWILE